MHNNLQTTPEKTIKKPIAAALTLLIGATAFAGCSAGNSENENSENNGYNCQEEWDKGHADSTTWRANCSDWENEFEFREPNDKIFDGPKSESAGTLDNASDEIADPYEEMTVEERMGYDPEALPLEAVYMPPEDVEYWQNFQVAWTFGKDERDEDREDLVFESKMLPLIQAYVDRINSDHENMDNVDDSMFYINKETSPTELSMLKNLKDMVREKGSDKEPNRFLVCGGFQYKDLNEEYCMTPEGNRRKSVFHFYPDEPEKNYISLGFTHITSDDPRGEREENQFTILNYSQVGYIGDNKQASDREIPDKDAEGGHRMVIIDSLGLYAEK